MPFTAPNVHVYQKIQKKPAELCCLLLHAWWYVYGRLQYLGYMFTTIFKVLFVEMYTNVAFVTSLYSTVSLTLVREQRCGRIITCYYSNCSSQKCDMTCMNWRLACMLIVRSWFWMCWSHSCLGLTNNLVLMPESDDSDDVDGRAMSECWDLGQAVHTLLQWVTAHQCGHAKFIPVNPYSLPV